jgi:hypothetical protein
MIFYHFLCSKYAMTCMFIISGFHVAAVIVLVVKSEYLFMYINRLWWNEASIRQIFNHTVFNFENSDLILETSHSFMFCSYLIAEFDVSLTSPSTKIKWLTHGMTSWCCGVAFVDDQIFSSIKSSSKCMHIESDEKVGCSECLLFKSWI